MAKDSFLIDQVSWHTRTPGNPEAREAIDRRFRALFSFLDRNGLLKQNAPAVTAGLLPDDFGLKAEHLTEEGLLVMKAAYDRWLAAVDHGTPPEEVKILEKALAKLRKHEA